MYYYINKNNWMDGVKGRCVKKCEQLTLTLEGADDPNYDEAAFALEAPVPLQALSSVLSGGFKEAELGSYWCSTESLRDELNRVNIIITIIVPDEPNCIADEVCANVRNYLNKGKTLANSHFTCQFVEGCTDKVLLTLIGDY